MFRSKRTPEEEIHHLRKKLRKLEERSPCPPISITGEYKNKNSRPHLLTRRASDDYHLLSTDGTRETGQARSEVITDTRASLEAVEAPSPSSPRENSNTVDTQTPRANSSRSELRANLDATEASSPRSELRANFEVMGAHSSTSTPVRSRASLDSSMKKTRSSSETLQTDNSDNSIPNRNAALLNALGDDLSLSGELIHQSLAQKWTTILRKGLSMEIKERLLKEYAAPENCKLLKAPVLNEEISTAVEYHARNRDKIMEKKQNQLGLGITAIARAITLLINQEGDKYEINAMRHFNHGCRLLLDLHFIETNSRRHLFKNDLNRSEVFRNLRIHELERDDTLFGNKVTKMVKKQGIPPTPALPRPWSSSYGDPSLSNHARNEGNLRESEPSRHKHN